jgi:hypothetical protein
VDEPRQRQGVLAPQSESVKHSSYEHPPGETRPAQGKQRPFFPPVHWESEEQLEHIVPAQDGPGPRCAGQDAGVLRCWSGTFASPAALGPSETASVPGAASGDSGGGTQVQQPHGQPHGPLQSQSLEGARTRSSRHVGGGTQGGMMQVTLLPPEPDTPPTPPLPDETERPLAPLSPFEPPLPSDADAPPVPTWPPEPGAPPLPAAPPVPRSPPRRGSEQLTTDSSPSNAEAVPISSQPSFLPVWFTRSKTCLPRPASVPRTR